MPRIEEMYAFIVEDSGPDDEGVIGTRQSAVNMLQYGCHLLGQICHRVDSLRPLAEGIGRQIGKKVTLVHFSNREDLEVIN